MATGAVAAAAATTVDRAGMTGATVVGATTGLVAAAMIAVAVTTVLATTAPVATGATAVRAAKAVGIVVRGVAPAASATRAPSPSSRRRS